MASHYYYKGISYKRNSSKNGGQYCGPCAFENVGKDRFVIEPASGHWWCRQCCANCKYGELSSSGYRYGKLDNVDKDPHFFPHRSLPMEQDHIATARAFHSRLSDESMEYLSSRGIGLRTADHFLLGTYNKKNITIPLLSDSAQKCQAIKYRVMPQYMRNGDMAYKAMSGHSTLGLFNSDALLARTDEILVIANSLFDVMTLWQLGFRVVGPYASESSWDNAWLVGHEIPVVVNIGDWDKLHFRPDGSQFRPGSEYMLQRTLKLSYKPSIERVICTYPPQGYTDINAAHADGVDISGWLERTIKYA